MRGLTFACALYSIALANATSAHAQTIYKCTDAGGKVSFSEQPCPKRATDGTAVQQQQLKPRARTQIERQWGFSEVEMRRMEEGCAKGDQDQCNMLKTLRTITPEQAQKNAEKQAVELCEKGNKLACEVAYCDDPPSPTCVQKTGRAYGLTWAELKRWTEISRSTISVRCVAPSATRRKVMVYCESLSDRNCRHDGKGPDVSIEQRSRQFESLDAAARDVCG